MVLKLTGWRQKRYPLAVYAGRQKVWEGVTPVSLGYVHLPIDKPVVADQMTIRMLGPTTTSLQFGVMKELAGGQAGELDRAKSAPGKLDLRIVEAEFLESAFSAR